MALELHTSMRKYKPIYERNKKKIEIGETCKEREIWAKGPKTTKTEREVEPTVEMKPPIDVFIVLTSTCCVLTR
jgi:hypothetical protein